MAHRIKVLTWHVHSSYLLYLTQADCDFYLPIMEGKYAGRGDGTWGDNVYDAPADEVKNLELDCILFQSRQNYLEDQYAILSPKQRLLPRLYLEHDPPREHPTDTRHVFDDPQGLLVHVTDFNNLMWDSGCTPTRVIKHGVFLPRPGISYTGELEKGVVVINNIASRGRRVGLDIFQKVREQIPLDLVGMNAQAVGGLESRPLFDLPSFLPTYRFFFNPIRYTSLGLAVCEAMLMGIPIVGMATTEMATTIQNGVTGYVSNDVDWLIDRMKTLLADAALARRLGENARAYAQQHFDIRRFAREWEETFRRRIERRE